MIQTQTQKENEKKVADALAAAGLDFVITRSDGNVCHVNVWIGEKS
jgi:hypothetical protein